MRKTQWSHYLAKEFKRNKPTISRDAILHKIKILAKKANIILPIEAKGCEGV